MAFYIPDPRVPRQPALRYPLPPPTVSHVYCDCATRLQANATPRGALERLAAYDPTHTTTIRNQFVSGMNRRWRRVRGLIRAAVVDQDCFGLTGAGPLPTAPVGYAAGLPGRRAFAFERSGDKVQAFRNWLDQMIAANIFEEASLPGTGLGRSPHPGRAGKWWGNRYIQTAYQKGIANTRRDLLSAGYDLGSTPLGSAALTAAFNHPVHIDRAGLVYTRVYEQLRGITNQMGTQISQVLAQGIMDGRAPRDIARLLNKTISGIGGTLELTDTLGRFIPAERRAQMLARTEVIRAHHLAGVAEMRSWGVVGVSVQAEFRTAADDRVCEECAALHGQRFTIDEIEGMIPVHPQCRCKAYPISKAQAEADAAEAERATLVDDPPTVDDAATARRQARVTVRQVDPAFHKWDANAVEPANLHAQLLNKYDIDLVPLGSPNDPSYALRYNIAKSTGQEMERLLDTFPALRTAFTNLQLNPHTAYHVSGGTEVDSKPVQWAAYYRWRGSNHASLIELLKPTVMARTTPSLSVGMRRHNVSNDVMSDFRHEYGHLIHRQLIMNGRWAADATARTDRPAFWIRNAYTEYKANGGIVAGISEYAAANEFEFFAEMFAAYTSPLYGVPADPRDPTDLEGRVLPNWAEALMERILGART